MILTNEAKLRRYGTAFGHLDMTAIRQVRVLNILSVDNGLGAQRCVTHYVKKPTHYAVHM